MKTVNDIFCVKQAVYKRVSIWQVYRQFCQDFTTSFVASIILASLALSFSFFGCFSFCFLSILYCNRIN